MHAINRYILDWRQESRAILHQGRARWLLGSPGILRGRASLLPLVLQGPVRAPRIPLLASVFYQPWHVKRTTVKRPFSAQFPSFGTLPGTK